MTIAVRPASRRRRPCLDPALGVEVDVRGRLVEDEDARVGDQRAGEGDELALAGRELRRRARRPRCRSPSGSAAMNSSAPTARAAARDLLVASASGRPKAMLSRDRAAEQERLLRHDPHLRAQRARASRRAGRGRRRARARRSGRRSARRAWRTSTCRRRSRRPARPSGPAGIVQVDVVAARSFVVLVGAVAERHVLEADLAAHARGSSMRVGRVDEVGLLVEQLEDLVERRHAGLVGRVELRELLDRVEEVVQRGDEADEHADRRRRRRSPGCRRRAGSRRSRAPQRARRPGSTRR